MSVLTNVKKKAQSIFWSGFNECPGVELDRVTVSPFRMREQDSVRVVAESTRCPVHTVDNHVIKSISNMSVDFRGEIRKSCWFCIDDGRFDPLVSVELGPVRNVLPIPFEVSKLVYLWIDAIPVPVTTRKR